MASVNLAMALAARVTVSGNWGTVPAARVIAPAAQGKVKVAEVPVPAVRGLAKGPVREGLITKKSDWQVPLSIMDAVASVDELERIVGRIPSVAMPIAVARKPFGE